MSGLGLATFGYLGGGAAIVGDDTTPPTITIVSPTPGTVIGPGTPIVFRYADETGLRRPMPMIKFAQGTTPETYKYELVHDGDNFTPDYDGVKEIIQSSPPIYQYTITRKGGWNATLSYKGGSPTFVPFGTDTGGNEPA